MSSYDPDSSETKDLLEVNIVDEMKEVLKAIDGKISPEMMDKLDWTIRAIQVRLSILEGNVSILEQSHLNHTNTSLIEFKNMHGWIPATLETENAFSLKKSEIAKMMMLTVKLRDSIIEVREWPTEEAYHTVRAAIKVLADAAGMEVVDHA